MCGPGKPAGVAKKAAGGTRRTRAQAWFLVSESSHPLRSIPARPRGGMGGLRDLADLDEA